MARGQDGNDIANSGNKKKKMTADYGQRAAMALNRLLPARNRNKAVERLFCCCPRQARNLRAGLYWTIDRLNQASAVLGAAFDAALITGDTPQAHSSEMREIAERLARLEGLVDGVVSGGVAVIPPPPSATADSQSREMPPAERARATPGDCESALPPRR